MVKRLDATLAGLDEVARRCAGKKNEPGAGYVNGHDSAGLDDAPPEFSEDALAETFVSTYGTSFRWSPGFDWLVDTGPVWSRDEKLRRFDAARTVARQASLEAEAAGLRPDTCRRIASSSTHAALLTVARSDRRIVVPSEVWDADPLEMNTPAGVVDLRGGALRARRAGDYFTQVTTVAPNPDMPCPRWLAFMDEIFCGDAALVDFMWRWLGYCLTGDRREQVLVFAHGPGANGKSVLLALVSWLAGTYALKLPAQVLMQAKGERHPTELAQLRGKRLAVSSEVEEGGYFNEVLVKELTGDEMLTARYMRQDFFSFFMHHKHVIAGNHRPRLHGSNEAMARRLLLVPFNATFRGGACDPLLLERLKAEGPGILAWLVQGCLAWQAGGLAVPPAVRSASADYMNEHDDLSLWIAECCVMSGEARSTDLYRSFRLWKEARGEHPPSQTLWGERMAQVPNVAKRKSHGLHVYGGIRLTLDAAEQLHAVRRQ